MRIFVLLFLITCAVGAWYFYSPSDTPVSTDSENIAIDAPAAANPNETEPGPKPVASAVQASQAALMNTELQSAAQHASNDTDAAKIIEKQRVQIEILMEEYHQNISDPSARAQIKQKIAQQMEGYNRALLPHALEQINQKNMAQ
jgi:DNA/RNA endonuclease YhcR with UshA esterase domain